MGIDLGGWALKLFDEVCSLIGRDNAFPPDEPEDARNLGLAWGKVATLLEGAVDSTNQTADKIFGEWVDSAGHEYLTMTKSFNSDLGGLIKSCKDMATFCEQYARDVHQQRMATRAEMLLNAASFALAFTGPGAVAGMFARAVAKNVLKRVVMAVGRTAASAQGRSTVARIGLNLGKEIAIEAGEEAAISASSQLASQAAGYNPDGINGKKLFTDTLAGSIGGALGYGPGKLVNGVVKPKGFVGQHVSAAVTGGGLNAVTSPVSSVAAHDLVNGEFSGLDDYGKAVKENAGDAARMGAFRANGTVLAGQAGSASGVHGYTSGLAGLEAGTGGGPDGPPPDNTPASQEAPGTSGASSTGDGSAGQGAAGPGSSTGQEGGASAAPDGAGTTGSESTGSGSGAGSGSGSGSEGAGGAGAGKGASSGSGSSSSGHESARTSTGDGSPDAGAEAEGSGAGQHSSQEGAATDPGTGEQSVAGGTTGDTAVQPAAGDPAAGIAGASTAGQVSGPAGQASGTTGQTSGTAGQSSNTAGQTASPTGQSGSVTSSSATGPAGSRNATSGKAEHTGDPNSDPTSGAPEVASTADPSTESTTDPAAEESTRPGESQAGADPAGKRPAEISPEVWQTLPQPVQDAFSRLFARNTTSQAVKNTVTRLAGLNVAEQAKQEITELAGTLQPSVLKALVDIAERAPTALDAAITLAKQNRAAANKTIRKIRDLAGRNATELQAFLDQLGDSGTAADKADEAKARPPRKRQAEPWARFPLPADHGLPKDARTARRRDVERAREADVVRDHLGPGLQRAADEAAATFKSRPPSQRFTGKRAETVDAAEQAAKQATEARQKAQEENADKAVVDELKKRESKAWRNFNITVKRESGSEIHAIFEEIIKRDHNKLLGEFADRYRLRTEAPYNLNGSARHPGVVRPDLVLERMSPNGGVWYTAHTYDLKTGETGITGSWAFRVDRMARGLFEVEEIRPSGSGRPAASEDPTAPDNGPHTNAPTPTGIDDATAALTDRKLPVADAVVAGIRALAEKMSPALLTRYLTNLAETISGAGKSFAEMLSAMTATQLDAFRAQLAEAGDVHAMLDRLVELGVDVDSARQALDDAMAGDPQAVMEIFAQVDAALALAEMHPALLAELGLPGLKITGLRVGNGSGVDITGRLADGREVHIEVNDHSSFGVVSEEFGEVAGPVARHSRRLADGGLVISLFTNEVSPAVADALVAVGADMVLRYDGFSTFSVMAERPTANPAESNYGNGDPDGGKPADPKNATTPDVPGRPGGIDPAVEALGDRKLPVADAVVAGIHALAAKMSPDLLTGYLTNIAETITRTAGKSLADLLSAMTATQLDAFRAQLARLAARPSLPKRFSGVPDHSATPAAAGEVGGGKGFVQEAGDVHAMLDRLEALGVNVDSARKALNDEMNKTDLQVWAESRATKLTQLEGNAQGLMGVFTEVEAALALAEMHPAMLAELGLPGLQITGVRVGTKPDVDIAGRLADGREVRIEVKDHKSFAVDSAKYTEIAAQVNRHREQLADDGLVISLFTNEVSPAVADALAAAGVDLVLRYDGYGTFSVMAERPAATPADPPGGPPVAPENGGVQGKPAESNGAPNRPAGLGSGVIAAPEGQPLLPAQHPVTDARTARIDAIAQASLRGADRLAGMSSVVPPAGDSQVHQVTAADGRKFDATVNAADLGGTVAATYHTDEQGIVRITVSSRAAPFAVPALVAAALAEVVAELSGHGAGVADFLVKDGSGDPILSRDDLGRAARLLAYDNLLRGRPLQLRVRSQLTKLIREMGLAPDQDGASSRLAALPDQRMRDAVTRHTAELDGLPGTLLHLAKNLGTAIPMSAALAVAAVIAETSTSFIAAMVASSLTSAVVRSLYGRSTAVREGTAAGEQFADRKRQLKDRAAAELGGAFLNALAQLKPAGNEHARTVVGPNGEIKGPAAVTAQLARIYGIPRNATALAALTAIGVVAALGATPVLGALSPIAALFVGASAVAPALVGPVLDAAKKRYTMALKAARNDALLTMINDLVAGRGHEIAAYAKNFTELVGARLAHEFGAPLTEAPGVKSLEFWYGDNAAAQMALNLVPRTRASNDKDRAADPNDLAAFLHLWGEYVGFRAAHTAATVGMNLAFGAKQHVAEQDASFARKQYDGLREADRDVAALASTLAAILGTTVPEFASPDENTPLAQDQERPSGLPSQKWLLVGVASGVLTLGVTLGMHALFGLGDMVPFAVGGMAAPVAEAYASQKLSAKELKLGDTKAELDRAAAQGARDKLTEALTEFGQHVQNGTDPAPSQATGTDPVVDRILADRDQAYRDLLNEVRQALGKPGAELATLGETIFDRLAALSDIAAKAEKLGTARATLAQHGQARVEVVARNQLIAALQKHNKIPGVTKLSMAGLLDGVHKGNADQHPLPGILSNLPALPADVTGQGAAVTMDQHLQNPDTPVEVSSDVAAWSGNEGWAARVAAAAGVPSGQFVPVATINDIVGRLQQLGAGSRAIVHARRTTATGVATSGDLLNAVNIGDKVYFLDAATGEPADVTQYSDGLSMLITNDNGEHARDMAGHPVIAKLRATAARLEGAYQDLVPGSLLTDPAAPGLPGSPAETSLFDGLTRIASVINPDRYLPAAVNPALGNDMPSIHAFSDQWDHEERPAPEPEKLVAGLGVARATAGLAVAMLDTFGDAESTDLAEFQVLTELLRQENIPPTELFDAMTDLMEALLEEQEAPDEEEPDTDTVDQVAERTGGPGCASTVDSPARGPGPDLGGGRGG